VPPATRSLLLAALVTTAASASAQTARPGTPADTARTDSTRQFSRVVVTATRTAALLEDVPIPTTVVDVRDAEVDGRLRLTDLLADVPGITITSDFGAGVQIQGLDPAYTLVLIDGEPVIGRDAGVLDLKRLAVAGLDRVEVVRGPSSSLYGSEALAGVINLVTRTPTGPGGRLRARAGTFTTTNFTAEAETGGDWRGRPVGVRLLLDRYDTDGYDLDPVEFGPTAPSVGETTADLRATAGLSDRTSVGLGVRATTGEVASSSARDDDGVEIYDQTEARTDRSVHPEVRHRFGRLFGAALAGRLSLYGAQYRLDTDITERANGSAFYTDTFDQRLLKGETTLDAIWSTRHRTLVGGGGWQNRLAGAQRYGADVRPEESTLYGFAQHDWEPSRLVALNLSARFDAHSASGSRLTPRAAVLLRPSDRYRLRLSVGSGFKTPDQRQLYLSFTNPAGGGYSVYGSERVAEGLARLEAEGRPFVPLVDPSTLGDIGPESSVAFNAEVEAEPLRGVRLTLGGFRHDIRDLIDTQAVAQLGTAGTGPLIYSYVNLNRVRSTGVTADVTAAPLRGLSVGAGYQWLRTRDLDVVDAIRAGTTVFIRDEAGRESRATLGDYTNLLGRATHQGTIRTAYTTGGWTASVRGRLRSRTSLRDLDGNGFATRDDEFVPATAIWDATVSRDVRLGRGLLARTARLQLGVDNAFGTTLPDRQPSLAGRRVYAALDVSF
jgi:outer membrane receptor for ferrienterochelin and colicins